MRFKHLVPVAALAALVLATPTLAQDDPQGAPGRRGASGMTSAPASQAHLITIDFKGGTLEDLVDTLKASSPDRPVNIIYSSEAGGIPIPPFEVRDAEMYATLQSLSVASSGTPTTLSDGRQARWMINRAGDSVYAIHLDNSPQYISTSRGQMLAGQSLRFTAIHSISELIAGEGALSPDDVLSALQAALAMDESEQVKLAYHESTGLIFARVTHDQGQVLDSTLQNLLETRYSQMQNGHSDEADGQNANLAAQIEKLMAENERLRQRIESLEAGQRAGSGRTGGQTGSSGGPR